MEGVLGSLGFRSSPPLQEWQLGDPSEMMGQTMVVKYDFNHAFKDGLNPGFKNSGC